MRGFTLAEILIAIGVFSIVSFCILGIVGSSGTNYAANLASINLQRQARQGMNWMVRDIRQAKLLKIQNPGTDKNNIAFDTPDETNVTYSLVAGQLWRGYPNGSVKANDITVLDFPPIAGNVQTIKLTAGKTFRSFGRDRTITFSLTEKVTVRN